MVGMTCDKLVQPKRLLECHFIVKYDLHDLALNHCTGKVCNGQKLKGAAPYVTDPMHGNSNPFTYLLNPTLHHPTF